MTLPLSILLLLLAFGAEAQYFGVSQKQSVYVGSALTFTPTTGATYVICVRGASSAPTPSLTLGNGDSATLAVNYGTLAVGGYSQSIIVWYVTNSVGGSDTVTFANGTGGSMSDLGISMVEMTNVIGFNSVSSNWINGTTVTNVISMNGHTNAVLGFFLDDSAASTVGTPLIYPGGDNGSAIQSKPGQQNADFVWPTGTLGYTNTFMSNSVVSAHSGNGTAMASLAFMAKFSNGGGGGGGGGGGSSNTVYVAQVSSGSGDGSTSGNRMSIASVNASWPLLPGGILSLGGTITNQVNVNGSGTAGAWETIYFEPNANLTSTSWLAYADGGCAIALNGNYYIHIDGGQNGLIQATNNGTGISTNHCVGIGGSAYFCVINNLRITNMYMKVKGVLDDTDSGYPINLVGSSITVSNCTLSDGFDGLTFSPEDAYQSNYFCLGTKIFNCNHSSQIGMANFSCYLTNVIYASNYFDHWDVWDCPGNTQIHLDGIFIWNNTYDVSSFITGIQIYNNNCGGYTGTRNTALFNCELYNGAYQLGLTAIFNNTAQSFKPGNWNGNGWVSWASGTNTIIANNTFISWFDGTHIGGGQIVMGNFNGYAYNNIFYYGGGLGFDTGTSNTCPSAEDGATTEFMLNTYFTNMWSDYNIWYDQGNGFPGFAFQYNQSPANAPDSWLSGPLHASGQWDGLGAWQTWYGNNRGMDVPIFNTAHCDPHSNTNQVTFVNGTFQPAASDTTARLAGTNLTALANKFGLTTMLNDANGTPHPTTGPWTIGAQEAASSGPVAPAFTQQPASVSGLTNTTLTLTWSASGDTSATWFRLQLTNGAVPVSEWQTAASWSTNSTSKASGWVVVVATNDFGSFVTSSPAFFQFTNEISPSFTTQPANQIGSTNITLTFNWKVSGDASTPYFEVMLTNNGVILNPWSVNNYWSSNSAVAQSNWIWIVATNDTGLFVTSSAALMQFTNGVGVKAAPSFTVQPAADASPIVKTNSMITYEWGLTNNGDPSGMFAQFQLTNNGTPISAWSPNTYFGTNNHTASSNWIWLVVTNDFASITSSAVLMQWTNGIFFSPTFTTQPQNTIGLTNTTQQLTWATSGDGTATAYAVMNTNSGTLVSAWQTATSWATNAPIVQANWFWVLATNDTGIIVTSAPALVTFTAVPTFINQPSSLLNITNYTEVFNWSATSDSSLNWYRVQLTNGTAVSAWQTSANWSTNSAVPVTGYFVVVVTNDAALYVTSSIASYQFTNGVLPVITGQPSSVTTLTNAAGVTESFTCTATGANNYQWYSVSNATTAPSIGLTLTTNSAVAQTNAFYMVASNPAGSVTSSVAIWITTNSIGLPVITSNPQTVQNVTNSTFTLTATATGTGPITLQWFNTNGWAAAPSITSAFTTNVTVPGTNWYALVAQNVGGSATSSVAGILASNGIASAPVTTFLMRARKF